jgi:CubicO group peptidase (beta-lactamase class C family)
MKGIAMLLGLAFVAGAPAALGAQPGNPSTLAVSPTPGTAAQPARTPAVGREQSAAELRAAEILRFIGSGDRSRLSTYASRAAVDAQQLVDQILAMHLLTRGAEAMRVDPVSANEAHAFFRSPVTGQNISFALTVESAAPHRIVSFARRPAPPAARAIPATEAERLAAIDAYARRLAEADYFSGVVLIARDGVPVLERAYGFADREKRVPNSLNTAFNLGSMNKSFTAIAIARLIEQGRLSWEDPLSRFMPDFPDREGAQRIQIRHLLSHTSGLGNYFNARFKARPMSSFRDLASYMDVAGGEPLAFAPGSRWSYSNTGMLALGRVIEIATGQDYYDHMRQHVFRPAGMNSTDSYNWDEGVPNGAVPHEAEVTASGVELRNAGARLPARGSPAGGGWSTAHDLLRLSNALRSGRLISAESYALMTSPKPEIASPRYGYGFDLGRAAPGRNLAGHGGDFAGTCAEWSDVRDAGPPYTVIILANSSMGSCHGLVRLAYEMIPAAQRL